MRIRAATPTPIPQPEDNFKLTVSQLSKMFPGTFYLRGNGNTTKIALTFDDGPNPTYTPKVLDVLKNHNVPATFFVMGSRAERNPDIIRRIISEGHTLANHTWTHPDLRKLSKEQIISEIQRTEEVLFRITGRRTALVRPPYGGVSRDVIENLRDMNYKIINWDVDSVDWSSQDVDQILINTLPSVRDESILLFHDGGGDGHSRKGTVDVLPELIFTLRMNGYEFVTVNELLKIQPYK